MASSGAREDGAGFEDGAGADGACGNEPAPAGTVAKPAAGAACEFDGIAGRAELRISVLGGGAGSANNRAATAAGPVAPRGVPLRPGKLPLPGAGTAARWPLALLFGGSDQSADVFKSDADLARIAALRRSRR